MAQVKFYTLTSTQYNALDTKDEGSLYFLSDTGVIYRGQTKFSFPVKVVETFPITGDLGTLYVTSAGAAKVWTGSSYVVLSSGEAPVDNFLKAAERHVVTAEEAGVDPYVGMSENDIGILFTLNTGGKLFVKLTDLVDTYTADNSSSKGVTVSVDGYKVGAEAKVSATSGNALSLKDDGLFVAKPTIPVASETTLGGVKQMAGATNPLRINGGGVAYVNLDSQQFVTGTDTLSLIIASNGELETNPALPGIRVKTASATQKGVVKVGANLSITADGTLSADAQQYTLPAATASTLGGVKVGSNLSVSSDGTISAQPLEWQTV